MILHLHELDFLIYGKIFKNEKNHRKQIKNIKFLKNHGDNITKESVLSEITYYDSSYKYLLKSPVNGTIIHKNSTVIYENRNIYNISLSWLYDIRLDKN